MSNSDTRSGASLSIVQVLSTDVQGVVVVALQSEILTAEAECNEVEHRLTKVAASMPGAKVVLDLEPVVAISSRALGQFINFRKTLAEGGGSVSIARVQPTLREVLTVTRLTEMFTIHDDLEGAINGF